MRINHTNLTVDQMMNNMRRIKELNIEFLHYVKRGMYHEAERCVEEMKHISVYDMEENK